MGLAWVLHTRNTTPLSSEISLQPPRDSHISDMVLFSHHVLLGDPWDSSSQSLPKNHIWMGANNGIGLNLPFRIIRNCLQDSLYCVCTKKHCMSHCQGRDRTSENPAWWMVQSAFRSLLPLQLLRILCVSSLFFFWDNAVAQRFATGVACCKSAAAYCWP